MQDNVLWERGGKGNGWRGRDEEILSVFFFFFFEKVTINFPFRAAGQIYIEGCECVSVGPNHKKASKN